MSVENENTALEQAGPLYPGELVIKNPYQMAEGVPCYRILIDFFASTHNREGTKPYRAAIAIPVQEAAYHPNELEGAATLAFLWAKEHDGLAAGMMAFCAFYYRETGTETWEYLDF